MRQLLIMPAAQQDAEQEQQPLLSSSGILSSVETSTTASPTTSRSYSNVRQQMSFLLPSSSDLTSRIVEETFQDERSPLLTSRRSRIRIAEGSTSKPRLSRHHSNSGKYAHY